VRILGPRSDERHLAAQHVHELRQLVHLGTAEERPEAEHTRIVGRRHSRRPLGRVDVHRPELEHLERHATASHSAGTEERRSGTREPDAERAERDEGGEQHEQQRREHDVQRALEAIDPSTREQRHRHGDERLNHGSTSGRPTAVR
jgi:hypothetical protein